MDDIKDEQYEGVGLEYLEGVLGKDSEPPRCEELAFPDWDHVTDY